MKLKALIAVIAALIILSVATWFLLKPSSSSSSNSSNSPSVIASSVTPASQPSEITTTDVKSTASIFEDEAKAYVLAELKERFLVSNDGIWTTKVPRASGGSQSMEFRNPSMKTIPEDLEQADALNGIESRMTVVVSSEVWRCTTTEGEWSRWENGGEFFRAKVEKIHGKWAVGPEFSVRYKGISAIDYKPDDMPSEGFANVKWQK